MQPARRKLDASHSGQWAVARKTWSRCQRGLAVEVACRAFHSRASPLKTPGAVRKQDDRPGADQGGLVAAHGWCLMVHGARGPRASQDDSILMLSLFQLASPTLLLLRT